MNQEPLVFMLQKQLIFLLTSGGQFAMAAGGQFEWIFHFIDRTKSGIVDFHQAFAARHYASRISHQSKIEITLIFDKGSVEMFADNGLSVMTSIYFLSSPFNNFKIKTPDNLLLQKAEYITLKGNYK